MKAKWLWISITGIFAVVLIIGGFAFHVLRNRPYGTVGYFTHHKGIFDVGKHFSKNGELIAQFYYNFPSGNPQKHYVYHYTYTLRNKQTGKTVLGNVPFINEAGQGQKSFRTNTDIPIAKYPNKLKLAVGEYEAYLLINGKQYASAVFYVDKPILVYPAS